MTTPTLTQTIAPGVLCAAVLSAACVGPAYHVPRAPAPVAAAYKEGRGMWKLAAPLDAIPRGRWWEMFHDPELDALERRLNVENQTIAQAVENTLQARAQIRAARASYFPTVTADPSATWFRSSGVTGGGAATAATIGSQTTSGLAGRHVVYAAPLDASWAPDLFGRVRYAVHQRQYAAQASAADLESIRLAVQTTLAQTYFQLEAQDTLEDELAATVRADQQIAELTRLQFTAGLATEIAVVQAELTLRTARVQATNAGLLRAQLEHAIATLVGAPATDFTLPRRALRAKPPRIPTGAPSQLLERRPDIAAAERQMASANAVIGLGYTAYYPLITLTGTAGFESSALHALFDWPSRIWALGATLSETVFDGGLRRANIDQAVAAYHASVASYRQTVLAAFQQVEDNLAALRVLAEELVDQRAVVELAQKALELEQARYEKGLDPYIDLALQQTAVLAAQQALVSLESSQMVSAVALVEALGGGWDRSELPTPAQVSQPAPPGAYEPGH
ncbi:MAG TPA: efflux transporter outer membrane subunit [Kofleriaceae bacterium]|jgi:NodT family efflux transporter outer membrane factor (OMF) lipoprotein|nr:efflux transporter outer membrane subunit [Kofleriaceae bacterium]